MSVDAKKVTTVKIVIILGLEELNNMSHWVRLFILVFIH
jgi:hypothetical protein